MTELIELSIDTTDGIADCRLELQETGNGYFYEATILYPNIVNGYNRAEVYCYNLTGNPNSIYTFVETEEGIHPKIKLLEGKIAAAITAYNK